MFRSVDRSRSVAQARAGDAGCGPDFAVLDVDCQTFSANGRADSTLAQVEPDAGKYSYTLAKREKPRNVSSWLIR